MDTTIARLVTEEFGVDVDVKLTRPDPRFGDWATNVALQLAGKINQPSREIAERLAEKLRSSGEFADVNVAGPGFINLTVTDERLTAELVAILNQGQEYGKPDIYTDKKVVTEYSDPNPFKVLHAGHLYTSIVGDAISNLIEVAGGEVHRVNFGGDVGLHVGKTMWAIIWHYTNDRMDEDEALQSLKSLAGEPLNTRSAFMTARYIEGTNAYEDNENAKQQIVQLNKRVYQLHKDNEHESSFAQIYWTCRGWSYDYFNEFYDRIGSHFERFYPESETAELGLATVRAHIGDVFEESDGAVIFKGEDHGLHTRVFINREGIPTYEAKDVGLIIKKFQDYNFDKSVVITGNEQEQYMTVVLKAIEQFEPELAKSSTHLTHGLVKLSGGVKMSSRKGNILRAVDVLDVAADANEAAQGNRDETTVLGAVKYAFLKNRLGGDIIYDPQESVSIHGNSGPYLQYAFARAMSITRQQTGEKTEVNKSNDHYDIMERSLLSKLTEYPDVLKVSVNELAPHHVCTYLYELAQTFNRFYEKSRVVGDERENVRINLVIAYTTILKSGLTVLGIAAPDKM